MTTAFVFISSLLFAAIQYQYHFLPVVWIYITHLHDFKHRDETKDNIYTETCKTGKHMANFVLKEHVRPVSTTVGVSPAVRVNDSIKVIFPGMSISNRCICRDTTTTSEIT